MVKHLPTFYSRLQEKFNTVILRIFSWELTPLNRLIEPIEQYDSEQTFLGLLS